MISRKTMADRKDIKPLALDEKVAFIDMGGYSVKSEVFRYYKNDMPDTRPIMIFCESFENELIEDEVPISSYENVRIQCLVKTIQQIKAKFGNIRCCLMVSSTCVFTHCADLDYDSFESPLQAVDRIISETLPFCRVDVYLDFDISTGSCGDMQLFYYSVRKSILDPMLEAFKVEEMPLDKVGVSGVCAANYYIQDLRGLDLKVRDNRFFVVMNIGHGSTTLFMADMERGRYDISTVHIGGYQMENKIANDLLIPRSLARHLKSDSRVNVILPESGDRYSNLVSDVVKTVLDRILEGVVRRMETMKNSKMTLMLIDGPVKKTLGINTLFGDAFDFCGEMGCNQWSSIMGMKESYVRPQVFNPNLLGDIFRYDDL
jgi:hypothetical protein